MNGKAILLGLAVSAGFLAGAAEYKSDGFCAKLSNNGMIKDITYKGELLITSTNLHCRYIPKDKEKQDNRFFQSWDYSGKTVEKKDGENTVFTTKSTLGNNNNNPMTGAVEYTSVITFSPEKITIDYSTTIKRSIYGNAGFISALIGLPGTIIGKGVKSVDTNGTSKLQVIPKTYKPYRAFGKELTFALGKGRTFQVSVGGDAFVSVTDSRAWKDKAIYLEAGPAIPWSITGTEYKPGKEFKWTVTITCPKK